jgi:HEAT repeat protein
MKRPIPLLVACLLAVVSHAQAIQAQLTEDLAVQSVEVAAPAQPVPPAPPAPPALPMIWAQAAPPAPPAPPTPAAAPAPPAPAQPAIPARPERAGKKEPRRPPTEDEALALTAIEGLMSAPPDRALPILKKVLNGPQSPLVKQRALFVLGQLGKPEAMDILVDYAKGPENPLKKEAIRAIGISGGSKALAALNEVYAVGDIQVKREVLNAWMIAGRKAEVFHVATTAKDEKEVAEAIRMLSAMGATEELRKLGDMQKSSKHLVQAYAISGDLQSLRKIANGSGELSTRVEAVRSIGIVSNDAARQALREIYSTGKEPQLREAALQGLLVANDQNGVLALYRQATNNDDKRKLLRTLSIMGGDAALEAIDAALEGKK